MSIVYRNYKENNIKAFILIITSSIVHAITINLGTYSINKYGVIYECAKTSGSVNIDEEMVTGCIGKLTITYGEEKFSCPKGEVKIIKKQNGTSFFKCLHDQKESYSLNLAQIKEDSERLKRFEFLQKTQIIRDLSETNPKGSKVTMGDLTYRCTEGGSASQKNTQFKISDCKNMILSTDIDSYACKDNTANINDEGDYYLVKCSGELSYKLKKATGFSKVWNMLKSSLGITNNGPELTIRVRNSERRSNSAVEKVPGTNTNQQEVSNSSRR